VIDAEGNAWTDNWTSATVSKFDPNGDLLGVYPVRKNPQILAIDAAGNVWVPNQGDDTVTKLAKDDSQIFTHAGACSRPRRFSHRWRRECVGIRHRFA
jgi:streptogramin lyase